MACAVVEVLMTGGMLIASEPNRDRSLVGMKRRIVLDDFPVADNHCFAFPPQASKMIKEDFVRLFAVGGFSVSGTKVQIEPEEALEQVRSAVSFKHAIKRLSEFLGCKNDLDSVVEARNRRSKEFPKYVKELFDSVRLQTLLIDSGFQPVSVDEFKTYVPTRVGRIFRIEPLVSQLLEAETSFNAFLAKFDEALLGAVRDDCLGFKTIIAYRTGIDIAFASEGDAKTDFERMIRKQEPRAWFGPVVKKLRDYLVRRTIEWCIKYDKVMQIHTGLGDTDVVASKCNPILLETFLKHEHIQPGKVVLIHGGYPYILEAAWLANVLPNVYLELSSPLPPYFPPAVSARRYIETIQQAPSRKIVYGSDAGEIPEMHWLSAKIAKQALQVTLEKLVELGMLDESDAKEIAKNILFENVRRLYKLT